MFYMDGTIIVEASKTTAAEFHDATNSYESVYFCATKSIQWFRDGDQC